MSHPSAPHTPSPPSTAAHRVEQLFEILIFGSRWIQAPLYGGLIIAELLYAAKFLTELWHMIVHFREETETLFMLGVLSLIDVTMVANLLFTIAAVVVVLARPMDLTTAGVVVTLASGVYTLVFADLQYLGVRRIEE